MDYIEEKVIMHSALIIYEIRINYWNESKIRNL